MRNIVNRTLSILMACASLVGAQTAVTVTNSNVALVRETRQLTLSKGAHRFDLTDIPAQIQPASVLVESPDHSFSVLEQNYEYDLVDVSKVLNKSLEQNIRVVHPELGEVRGKLISASGSALMLVDGDKQLQIIPRSDELKIFLDNYSTGANGFVTRPTLRWQVKATQSGAHRALISYLTGGLSWKADYVGRLNKDDSKLTVACWVTVDNKSGKTFKDARLKLMAGDINLVKSPNRRRMTKSMALMDGMAGSGFSEKSFFEYHLYSLGRLTTIANNQVKQIQLFPEAQTAVSKEYVVESTDPKAVNVMVSFKNSRQNHLGIPLPGGVVRLYKADGKDMEFIGEDAIRHTPKDEEVKIKVGQAFDVVSVRNVLKTERPTNRSRRYSVEYVLRNHKKEDVRIHVQERFSAYQQTRLHKSNIKPFKQTAGRMDFIVPVPADGERKLTLSYTTSW